MMSSDLIPLYTLIANCEEWVGSLSSIIIRCLFLFEIRERKNFFQNFAKTRNFFEFTVSFLTIPLHPPVTQTPRIRLNLPLWFSWIMLLPSPSGARFAFAWVTYWISSRRRWQHMPPSRAKIESQLKSKISGTLQFRWALCSVLIFLFYSWTSSFLYIPSYSRFLHNDILHLLNLHLNLRQTNWSSRLPQNWLDSLADQGSDVF